jgi:hypothetical protein
LIQGSIAQHAVRRDGVHKMPSLISSPKEYVIWKFSALISILLFIGCTDPEGILELKGKILELNTKVTISNRKVIIRALQKNDNEFISSYTGTFSTDSSGCFAYSLKKVKNVYLYEFCIVGDTAYASLNNILGLTELDRDGMFLSFYLDKLTDFTIKINRLSNIPLRDTLYVTWVSNGIDGKTLYPYEIGNYWTNSKQGLRWIGGDINSIIKTKVFADKKTIVTWELFRGGKYKEIKDTIFCLRNAANIVSLKY